MAQTTPIEDSRVSDTVKRVSSMCSVAKDIHLPPSPPPSPRHATPPPAIIRGPEFILPDADLAATPTRTAASPTSLTSSNSSLCDHPEPDQVDTGPILACACNKERLSSQCITDDASVEQQPLLKEHTDKEEVVTRMCFGGSLPQRRGKGSSPARNPAQSEPELLL